MSFRILSFSFYSLAPCSLTSFNWFDSLSFWSSLIISNLFLSESAFSCCNLANFSLFLIKSDKISLSLSSRVETLPFFELAVVGLDDILTYSFDCRTDLSSAINETELGFFLTSGNFSAYGNFSACFAFLYLFSGNIAFNFSISLGTLIVLSKLGSEFRLTKVLF